MPETGLRIRVFGDPVLRRKARAVAEVTPEHAVILSQMAQAMYAGSGIGLAATQVGINQAMIVVDIGKGLFKLINPRIARKEGRQAIQEGCLSVPGVCIKVARANKVLVRALDESGNPLDIQAEGLLACVLQHEIDHLKGKLIVDYAPLLEKIKIKKKLSEMRKRAKHEKLLESEAKSCKLQL